MPEETTSAPAAPPDPAPAASGQAPPEPAPRPDENLKAELKRRTAEQKATAEENAKLAAELDAFKAEKLSDIEKAQAAAEKYKAENESLKQEAIRSQRSAYVKDAAQAAGYADPADAVAFLGAELPEDSKAAEAAVKELAEQKPHLLKGEGTGPQPIGAPLQPGSAGEVPMGADGKPDIEMGIGQDLLRAMGVKRG